MNPRLPRPDHFIALLLLALAAFILLQIGLAIRLAHAADKPPDLKAGATFSGKIVAVHDGDTYTIETADGVRQIRPLAADTPELEKRGGKDHWPDQPFGHEARDRAAEFLLSNEFTCRVVSKSWERYVCVITRSDGLDVSSELVRRGLAWVDPRFNKGGDLPKLEAEARAAKRGLWAKRHTAPWDFRKGKR